MSQSELQLTNRTFLDPGKWLAGDYYCSVHPRMIGADILVSAAYGERVTIDATLRHVFRVEPLRSRWNAHRGHRVRSRIIVRPLDRATLGYRNICRHIIEGLICTDTVRHRYVHNLPGSTVSIVSRAGKSEDIVTSDDLVYSDAGEADNRAYSEHY